jgi:hypothetical protein
MAVFSLGKTTLTGEDEVLMRGELENEERLGTIGP